MSIKIKSFLFSFDFIGIIPQLRILNYKSYKSIFSSLISIIIILISIFFAIYSLIEYIYQDPIIDYYKSNDYTTNKTILISDTFLMFKIDYIYCGDIDPNITYEITYENTRNIYDFIELKVEPCELGKNINLKYKNLVEYFEKNENTSINNFYCINFNNQNFSLSYNPNDPFYQESLIYLSISLAEDYNCSVDMFSLHIVTENDIINHNNKNNPIIPTYRYDIIYYSDEKKLLMLDYNFQYIKYESDDGIFFKNSKIINGIGFSGISSLDNINKERLYRFAGVYFKVNKSNYDLYKRTYQRFQSLLADVVSIVNLMIEIGKLISYFLLNKKMSKDIVRRLITKNENKEYKFNDLNKINNANNIFNNIKNIKNISERKSINSEFKNKKSFEEILNKSDKSNKIEHNYLKNDITLKSKHVNKTKINIMKKLNLWYIIKSLFCFKDNKIKLIDLCHNIVIQDLCIDKILKRLYKLEKIYCILSDEQLYNLNLIINKEFEEINKYLFQISKELKIKN